MRKLFYFFSLLITGTALFSCGGKNADFTPAASVKDYFPVQTGKFITYRVDSTVFVKSGSQIEIHKYQVRHTTVSTTNDNQGRLTYIVQREIRNADGSGNWTDNGRYYITPLENSVEVIEDNLRVIKVAAPIQIGATWKGNAYLVANPYESLYDFQVGKTMNTWEFKYNGFGDETIEGQQYKDVWTIEQVNDSNNLPPTPGVDAYGYMEVVSEKYSKGIGMVYRDFNLYDLQPKTDSGNPQNTYTGFAIRMWMIDHN